MSRTDLFLKSYGWVGAILLAIGVGLAVASVVVSAVAARFTLDGMRTEAEVVSSSRRETSRMSDGVSIIYGVTVRHIVNGETYEVSQGVRRWFYDRVRPIGLNDGTIPVTYLDGDPGKVKIVRGRSGRTMIWLRLGALVGLVAGGCWVWTAWSRARAVLGLRERG